MQDKIWWHQHCKCFHWASLDKSSETKRSFPRSNSTEERHFLHKQHGIYHWVLSTILCKKKKQMIKFTIKCCGHAKFKKYFKYVLPRCVGSAVSVRVFTPRGFLAIRVQFVTCFVSACMTHLPNSQTLAKAKQLASENWIQYDKSNHAWFTLYIKMDIILSAVWLPSIKCILCLSINSQMGVSTRFPVTLHRSEIPCYTCKILVIWGICSIQWNETI